MATTRTEDLVAATRSVESVWHGGYHCSVEAGPFTIQVDEPEEVGGANLGPQPTDLFLASVASCFTLAISYAARKRSLDLTELTAGTTACSSAPSTSRRGSVHPRPSSSDWSRRPSGSAT